MKGKFIKLALACALTTGILVPSSKAFAMNRNALSNLNSNKSMVLLAKNDSLQDGKYNVSIETLKEKNDELSMAGQYIDSNATLDVSGGKTYVTIKVLRNDWMKNIRIFVDDSQVNYEHNQLDNEGKVSTLKFAVPNSKSNVKFRMNVVPMGNADVCFRVALKDNITKISGETSTGNTKVSKDKDGKELPQTGFLISSGNLLLIGGVSTMVGAGLFKKRK